MLVLQPRRPGLSHEDFSRHWRTIHAEHARRIAALQKYVQSHRSALTDTYFALGGIAASEFDGISEAWFTSREDALGMASSQDYRDGALRDEPNFLDIPRKVRLFCPTAPLIVGEGWERAVTKLVLLVTVPTCASPSGALAWGEELAERASMVPGVVKLAVGDVEEVVCADPALRIDHVLELGWSDSSTLDVAMHTEPIVRLLECVAQRAPETSALVVEELRFI